MLAISWSGCDQELDALDYYKEARSIMNEAHFNLCCWSSNSSSLRDQTARESTADTNAIVNILGLRWGPSGLKQRRVRKTNSHQVQYMASLTQSLWSLRALVSSNHKSQTSDPRIVAATAECDEPLSPELSIQHEIAQNFEEAATITLHRCFFPSSEMQSTAPYLHVFADASPQAYGAVSCITSGDQCSLVMAKSSVSP